MHGISHTQEHLYVASNFCSVHSDAQYRSDIQLPHSWTILSGDFHATLRQQPGPHIYGWANPTFATPMETHTSAQTFNSALTLATHISLRHLAARIPSQLHNYFLPSYDLQHKSTLFMAVIKPSWKPYGIIVFSPLFSNKYSEELTQQLTIIIFAKILSHAKNKTQTLARHRKSQLLSNLRKDWR